MQFPSRAGKTSVLVRHMSVSTFNLMGSASSGASESLILRSIYLATIVAAEEVESRR